MNSKILINAVDSAECRIARVKESKLEEFHIESASKEITHGNIYKSIITRIEPSLQAIFIDYGAARNGFLQKHELHPDYYQNNASDDRSINNIVKKGQELMVQVTKDPFMKKGAMLTTYISLPGRYVVLMPGSDVRGISRKIETEEERHRLRDIAATLKIPEEFGLIVRTAGSGATKTNLSKDLNYLLRLWKTIKNSVMKVKTPALLYKERNLVLRSLRDYLTPEVSEILIDNPLVHQEALKFIKIVSPKHADAVKLHKGPKPIFTKHDLENQIASIFESRVELKSGGSIVLEQTEALVAIDVNSGKATQKKTVEQTALQTNLEAAEEIARQLRLRDLGGLIVLDFIDMREHKHRSEVERALKNHMKTDKAKTKISKISTFGLIEMSRQRLRPSIEYGSYETCKCCGGKGMTPSAETMGLSVLRKIHVDSLKPDIAKIVATLPVSVSDYILNHKRKELLEIENRLGITILIQGDSAMLPTQSQVACEKRND